MPKGNNTIFFIPRGKVPNGKMVTYFRIVSEVRPYKAETHRIFLTVVVLVNTKILFNSTLFTPGVRFSTFDIKYFYYGIPMEYYKYIRKKLSAIPQEIIY